MYKTSAIAFSTLVTGVLLAWLLGSLGFIAFLLISTVLPIEESAKTFLTLAGAFLSVVIGFIIPFWIRHNEKVEQGIKGDV